MSYYPVFLSVVCATRNQADIQENLLHELTSVISPLVSDYELIIVDNASTDTSVRILKQLSSAEGIPNLQVYALTKEVDADTAAWVGLENALGDFVVVIDPLVDDIRFLPRMLDAATSGSDVVFARNEQKPPQDLSYRIAFNIFNSLYKLFNDIHLADDAPHYRLLSRKVINLILQHPQPSVAYRHLPASGGFIKTNLSYDKAPTRASRKRLGESIDRGLRLLVSTTRGPLRLVTTLSLFGAFANVVYSIYVVAVGLFKDDVAPGWISLSLQQSGMFFLISLVLLVLGEYIITMVSQSNEGPRYHVGQEFTSVRMTRRERLNVEEIFPEAVRVAG